MEQQPDPVDKLLSDALGLCQEALADYEAGLLSDSELRKQLVGGGTVRHEQDVWLLDLEAGAWLRYDGVTLHGPKQVVRRSDVQRWRRSIVTMMVANS